MDRGMNRRRRWHEQMLTETMTGQGVQGRQAKYTDTDDDDTDEEQVWRERREEVR